MFGKLRQRFKSVVTDYPEIAATYFIFSLAGILTAYYGLCGHWQKEFGGLTFGSMWDPSSIYIGSAIELTASGRTSSAAHPGLPLMYLLNGLYRLIHLVSLSSVNFYEYLANQYFTVVFASRLLTILIHGFCAYLLWHFARIFTAERWHLSLSVLLYFTGYWTMFYMNMVSPEPYLLMLTLCLWFSLVGGLKAAGKKRWLLLLGAGFLCAAGILTKIMVMAPLLAFGSILILYQRISVKQKSINLLMFYFGFTISFVVLAATVNWQDFFSFWTPFSPGNESGEAFEIGPQRIFSAAGSLIWAMLQGLSPAQWLPAWTRRGIVNIGELPMLVFAGLGFYLYLRQNKISSEVKTLLLLLALLAPIALFRNSFHYYYIQFSVACVFAPFGIRKVKEVVRVDKWNPLVYVVVLHGFSVFFCFSLRLHDIQNYQTKTRHYYDALRSLQPGQKIGLVNDSTYMPGVWGYVRNYVEPDSIFHQRLSSVAVGLSIDSQGNLSKPEELETHNIGALVYRQGDNYRLEMR